MSKQNDLNNIKSGKRQLLTHKLIGNKIPRRGGAFSPPIGRFLMKLMGWKSVGNLPNVKKAVLLALPHTSNYDGIYAIPCILALDIDIKLLGKDSLFKYPVLANFFDWVGIIPINRSKRGTVLQASIDKMKNSESMFLGLAPEGTRGYTEKLKTGFYYIAKEAEVPIVPVAMDYKTKEIRFLEPVYATGNFEEDMHNILVQYKGVVPKYPAKMAQVLQDINKDTTSDK